MPSFLLPDAGLLFWMCLAFVIVFVVLARFGFPVITKMVEERKQFIDESLQHARAANEKLAGIQAESEQILQEARRRQDAILKEAAATGQRIIAEAREKARAEGEQQLEEARRLIQAEKERALRDIRTQVADLSVDVAEQILRNKLTRDAEQRQLVDRLLDEALAQR